MTLGTGDLSVLGDAPLNDLYELVRARHPGNLVDEAVATAVARAREAEVSWGAIAAVLRGAE